MKIARDVTELEMEGQLSTPHQFKIAASREAFSILSSGLYNDKITAIIRELSCNAYDAHVAAGKKEVPFEVHLPTYYEPYFSIKDYGIGLSDEEVKHLYTTYFATNKSESNEYIGALGLGSKSPFCYTEVFTVISRYNGKTRGYSAYIDDNGLPEIVCNSEEDTPDAPNGLEVSFPTKQYDYSEFERKAGEVYEFFNPLPTTNIPITVSKQEYTMKTEGWGIRKGSSGIRAIQGMVPYEVGSIDESRMTKRQKDLFKLPLDLFFPIGELSVAASRETLSNDERTIGNVLRKLDEVALTLKQEVVNQVKACTSQWDVRLLLNNLINTPGLRLTLQEVVAEMGNIDLDSNPTLDQALFDDKVKISLFLRTPYAETAAKSTLTIDRKKESRANYTVHFRHTSSVAFVLGDIPFGAEKYIHYFLQQSSDRKDIKAVYLISRANKDVPAKTVVEVGKSILQMLGDPPFMLLSELKEKYKESLPSKLASSGYKIPEGYWFDIRGDISKYSSKSGSVREAWGNAWVGINKDYAFPSGRKYYVVLEGKKLANEQFDYAEDFGKFLTTLRKSSLADFTKTDVVYGFTKAKVPKGKDWLELFEYTKSLASKITPELELTAQTVKLLDNVDITEFYEMKKKDFSSNSEMYKFLEEIEKVKKRSDDEDLFRYLVRNGHYTPNTKNVIKIDKHVEKIRKHYPMLTKISRYSNWGDPIITEYINMVDRFSNNKQEQEQEEKEEKVG